MKFNLNYHVWLIDDPILYWHLDNLKKYLSIFNGRKIIMLSVGKPMKSKDAPVFTDENIKSLIERIKSTLNDFSIEYLIENNQPFGETPHYFDYTLPRLYSENENEFTFYGHSKGITRHGLERASVLFWTNYMYHWNLMEFDSVRRLFENKQYNAHGIFKCVGQAWEQEVQGITWHYPGAFFWFRHKPYFSDPRWQFRFHRDMCTVEYSLGLIFSQETAYDAMELPQEFWFTRNQKPHVANRLFDINGWNEYFLRIRGSEYQGIEKEIDNIGYNSKEL